MHLTYQFIFCNFHKNFYGTLTSIVYKTFTPTLVQLTTFSNSIISVLSLNIVHLCRNKFHNSSLQPLSIRRRSIFGSFCFKELALMWTLLCIISKKAQQKHQYGVAYVQLFRRHLITGIFWFKSVWIYLKKISFMVEFVHRLITKVIQSVKQNIMKAR